MVFKVLHPEIGYHFCPCWYCIPDVILRYIGTILVFPGSCPTRPPSRNEVDRVPKRCLNFQLKFKTNYLFKLNFSSE